MKRFALLVLAFVAMPLAAADIVITGPGVKVKSGRLVVLRVDGLEDADLSSASVKVVPTDGVLQISPSTQWGGQRVIHFQAEPEVDTQYSVSVTVNKWRQNVELAVADAKRAKIDSGLLAEFESLAGRMEEKYPSKTGACSLEVAGSGPPQPPTPPTPPVPTVGKRLLVVLHETNTDTPEMAQLVTWTQGEVSKLHQYLKEKSHPIPASLDDDLPEARKWLDKAGTARPVALIVDPAKPDSSGVLGVAELKPATSEKAIEILKQFGG